ncbi:MAG: amidinotransferase [Bacteroidetes bacterium]|jgi:hypothetical protein|nr:amidinotransferase [Bacteroidota bacterium]
MPKKQTTNHILMIRPTNFRMNDQTAVNNFYQQTSNVATAAEMQAKALQEFNKLVEKLKNCGCNVIVIDDLPASTSPDSIFPNNWISFHQEGDVVMYPMFAENRRTERREEVLDVLEDAGFVIENIMDYTDAELEKVFLEGTGSMVLDRVNKNAYCALSQRSDEELFIEFCEDFDYNPVVFTAYQTVNGKREKIYHTNVMMSVGEKFAVICIDAIDDTQERRNVLNQLRQSGKEIILITEQQVNCFAGNMLEIKGKDNESIIVLSETAYNALTALQKNQLQKFASLVYSDINTIEKYGGGSVRCMMAEVFLPKM